MDEIMAEQKQQEELQKENEVLDKKQLKAAKKLEKKKRKQKNPDDLDGDEETVGGKILVFFVTIIIILIWLAIFAMLIKLDVGGFGSGVLAPVIKDVPYLNKILPDSITGEHCGEASAEFSILLPPRRPRFGTAVALFTWFCVCAVTLLSMDLKDGPPFRLPTIPYPMRQAAAGFWHELKSHYNKSRCRKQ